MLEKDFPILEFDEERNAFIRPENDIKPVDIAERCVLCFFSESIEKMVNKFPHKIAAHFKAEGLFLPVLPYKY
ncbi:hypothetical protein FACS189462_0050 [Spirochaetia bacterium]|nr:hypothetical protein FACS189462_0050 [Spirochaetia bacterium]